MRTSEASHESRGHSVNDPVLLVIMEDASAWPSQAAALGASSTIVLKQEGHESQAELVQRTRSRVRVLERSDAAVGNAVICCNNDTSTTAVERRTAIARTLFESGVGERAGRLELVARPDAAWRVRQALLDLAGTLTGMLVGTSASVVVRLTDAVTGQGRTGAGRFDRRSAA